MLISPPVPIVRSYLPQHDCCPDMTLVKVAKYSQTTIRGLMLDFSVTAGVNHRSTTSASGLAFVLCFTI